MDYQEYLKSEGWKAKRNMILNMWGNRCALCNKGGEMHLHHRDYKRVGNEEVTDVIPLCKKHHELFHNKVLLRDTIGFWEGIIVAFREVWNKMDGQRSRGEEIDLDILLVDGAEYCIKEIKRVKDR